MPVTICSGSRWFSAKRLLGICTVVGAFIGLTCFVAMLVQGAREDARRSRCHINLAMIGLALDSYRSRKGTFPDATGRNDRLPPEQRKSWQLSLLSDLFCSHCWGLDDAGQIDPTVAWDVGPQRTFAVLPLEPVLCPSSSFQPAQGTYSSTPSLNRSRLTELVPATYVGIAGIGNNAALLPAGDPKAGVFGYDRSTRLEDIRDGASSTMTVAETADLRGPWTSGGPATVRGVDPERQPYLGRGRQFGGNHEGGTLILFADGSVRFIRGTIDPHVFEALATIAGGEPLPQGWDH